MRNEKRFGGMKVIALMMCCGILLTGHLCGAVKPAEAREIVDRIVAVVNEDIILLSELRKEMEPFARQVEQRGYDDATRRKMLFKVRGELLERMIEKKLTQQEIDRQHISIPDDEIDATIERLKEANFLTDEELRKKLKEQSLSYEEYRERIRDQLLRSRLLNREVRSKIVVTQEDVKKYFDAHQEEYKGEAKVHLRHVTVSAAVKDGTINGKPVRQYMQTLLTELDSGTDFKTIEKRVSHLENVMAGDLGTFRLKTLSAQLQSAIASLGPGDHTSLLETDQGFQIFYIQDIERDSSKTLKDVTASIEQKLFNERVDEKFDHWLKALKSQSHIRIIN